MPFSVSHFCMIILQVATDSLQIEVRNLKKASELSHSFQTIDQVNMCTKKNLNSKGLSDADFDYVFWMSQN